MYNKFLRMKRKIAGVACVGVFSMVLSANQASACKYHQGWDLVDSSRDIDWEGSTKYSSAWKHAINEWNAMGAIDIQKDTLFTRVDVSVKDVNNKNSGWGGITHSDGRIEFNTYYLDNYSASERKKTATHELGHALGIAHVDKDDNVMWKTRGDIYTLGTLDMSTYRCLWGYK